MRSSELPKPWPHAGILLYFLSSRYIYIPIEVSVSQPFSQWVTKSVSISTTPMPACSPTCYFVLIFPTRYTSWPRCKEVGPRNESQLGCGAPGFGSGGWQKKGSLLILKDDMTYNKIYLIFITMLAVPLIYIQFCLLSWFEKSEEGRILNNDRKVVGHQDIH